MSCLIPVLVHMYNPSFVTHFSSQFWYTWYTSFIPVLVYIFHLNHLFYTYTCTYTTALTLLGHALPGANPWSTSLIPFLVHIFNLCFVTVALKWNTTDKIWDFSTTDVAIWMNQSVGPKYSLGWFLWGGLQDIKCAWFSLEGFIFESINFELSQFFLKWNLK